MLRRTTECLVLAGFLVAARAQQIEIRMATLAPEGSPWHKVLERMGERWRIISGGKVKLNIFPGGTLGDEPDLVNKMRINQIQAVALSGVGMSDVEPGVRCLQIPMMFDSYEELDYVRDRVAPRLEKMIESRGYLVLNWGDAGWVHIFSKTTVRSLDDLRKIRLFTWAGDNEELELWKANKFKPVALAATDILMGLQTGLIDAVPTTPLYALWNQCFALANHMNDIKWAPLIGATLISKAAWEKIPQDQRVPMLQAARDSGEQLRSGIRSMGDAAITAMMKGQPGKRQVKLTVTHGDASLLADWRKQAEDAYPKMRGKLIPADLFDEVRRLRDEYRELSKGARK